MLNKPNAHANEMMWMHETHWPHYTVQFASHCCLGRWINGIMNYLLYNSHGIRRESGCQNHNKPTTKYEQSRKTHIGIKEMKIQMHAHKSFNMLNFDELLSVTRSWALSLVAFSTQFSFLSNPVFVTTTNVAIASMYVIAFTNLTSKWYTRCIHN